MLLKQPLVLCARKVKQVLVISEQCLTFGEQLIHYFFGDLFSLDILGDCGFRHRQQYIEVYI